MKSHLFFCRPSNLLEISVRASISFDTSSFAPARRISIVVQPSKPSNSSVIDLRISPTSFTPPGFRVAQRHHISFESFVTRAPFPLVKGSTAVTDIMLVANWSKCTLVRKRSPKRNGAAIRFHVTRFGLIRDIENHQHQDHEPVKDSKFHVGILFSRL